MQANIPGEITRVEHHAKQSYRRVPLTAETTALLSSWATGTSR